MFIGSAFALQADVLFYTDFHTTPPGFKAASDKATTMGTDDTLLKNPSGATAAIDTVIDGCTLTAPKSSSTLILFLISKGTQSFVKAGDTIGCTPGRISMKNSNCSIALPSVLGPCSITYYAAASSASAGRGVQCLVNGISTDEAGISELLLNGTTQATMKKVYNYTGSDSVVFTLISIGGIYIYDIKVESGAASVIISASNAKSFQRIQKVGNTIQNSKNLMIDIFSILGAKIASSNKSIIDMNGFTPGIYMARIAGTKEYIKIVR
jgi:hypothetical protein